MAVLIGACPQLFVHRTREDVHGDVDEYRAGTSGFCQTESLIHNVGQRFYIVHAPSSLDNRFQHAILIAVSVHLHFLMRMTAKIITGNITSDDNHGDRVERSVGNTGDHISQSRSQMTHDHRGLVSNAGITVSCGGSHGLLTSANVLNFFTAGQRVKHADDGVTTKAEQFGNAAAFQVIHQQIRNQFFAHF
ncbi:hypothetical protein SDC9_140173 [bioreactor metagenome]|uniref:Uncharacterized protein n=1 Tax=bioreactor metagenome TaxID=1076179 RepID=A0A645DUH8_9ZZZZ